MKRKDLVFLIICLALLIAGAAGLVSHFTGRQAEKQTAESLRQIYRAADAQATEIPTLPPATPTPAPRETETATAAPQISPVLAPAATVKPATRLSQILYPDNPGLSIREPFRSLRRENGDIVGWLTVGKMIDEAVAQRDNEYYMDHDLSGRNYNGGAVFLDQLVSLRVRPYGLILYGHNMRDQSRFGWLRKYEDRAFYLANRLITFNTIYEDGRYVVFSEGTVSTEEEDEHFLDFFGLESFRADERAEAIRVLQKISVLDSGIDVRVDDQILLLVTCVDKDTERRVVAARRLREGENEQFLN